MYEIEDDTHLQILMVNDRYYRITGCNAVDLQERSRLITRQIHPEDMPLVDVYKRQLKYSDGDLEICLKDTGDILFINTASGLDQVQVARLFDRFYTVRCV